MASSSTSSPSAEVLRVTLTHALNAGDSQHFIKAVIKNDFTLVRKLIVPELVDMFFKTRKGELINPLYVCIKK